MKIILYYWKKRIMIFFNILQDFFLHRNWVAMHTLTTTNCSYWGIAWKWILFFCSSALCSTLMSWRRVATSEVINGCIFLYALSFAQSDSKKPMRVFFKTKRWFNLNQYNDAYLILDPKVLYFKISKYS